MAIDISTLNSQLSSFNSKVKFAEVLTSTFDVQEKLAAAVTTKLGTEINQVIGGFQALTQQADTALDAVMGGGVAMLAQDPPGLQITKDVSSSKNDLEALTEDIVDGGFLNIAITANTPEAIGKALSSITGKPASAILPALQEIGTLTDKLPSVVGNFIGGTNFLSDVTTKITSLQNIVSLDLSSGLSAILSDLPNQLQGTFAPINAPIKNIGSNAPVDPVTQDVTFVNSSLEVQAVLNSTQREITTVVVSASETFKDQDVRASKVAGYHFLITRTGELQQPTPINTDASIKEGWNKNTIGVMFAGGLNTTIKEGLSQNKAVLVSSNSYTANQWKTFDKLMTAIYNVFPHAQTVSLSEIPDTNTRLPGFEASSYCLDKFGKDLIINTTKPAPTLAELETQMRLNAQGVSDPGIEDEPNEADTGPQ